MKNLAISISLILAFASTFAEAQICAPFKTDIQSNTNLESIGLLNFTSEFEDFRVEHLKDTSLCNDELKFTTFESDIDFVRMERSNVYIEVGLLAELGKFSTLHKPSQEEVLKNRQTTSALMGVMTYLSYANADKLNWYKAEASANVFGNTAPLSEYNNNIATRMVQEKPLMAFGLGVYRVLTLDRITPDKRAYKQETHATPYQIAHTLVDNEQFELARELLVLAEERNYRLADETKQPEIGLEALDQMIQSLK